MKYSTGVLSLGRGPGHEVFMRLAWILQHCVRGTTLLLLRCRATACRRRACVHPRTDLCLIEPVVLLCPFRLKSVNTATSSESSFIHQTAAAISFLTSPQTSSPPPDETNTLSHPIIGRIAGRMTQQDNLQGCWPRICSSLVRLLSPVWNRLGDCLRFVSRPAQLPTWALQNQLTSIPISCTLPEVLKALRDIACVHSFSILVQL